MHSIVKGSFYRTDYPKDGIVGFMTIRTNLLENEKDIDNSGILPVFSRTWRITL
jgi:hypothetical protein